MLHEMGHVFAFSNMRKPNRTYRYWYSAPETVADLFVSYAIEKGGFSMGYPRPETGPNFRYSKFYYAQEEIEAMQTELKSLQDRLKALPKIKKNEPELVRLYNGIAALENRLNAL